MVFVQHKMDDIGLNKEETNYETRKFNIKNRCSVYSKG